MDIDVQVPFPSFMGTATGLPVTGDNVIYSTRKFVSSTSGRPASVGPLLSGEQAMQWISGSYVADQASTLKWQQWDEASQAWVTTNNNGAGDATTANNPMNFVLEKTGGGDWQVVVNFGTPPTSLKHSKKIRLSRTS